MDELLTVDQYLGPGLHMHYTRKLDTHRRLVTFLFLLIIHTNIKLGISRVSISVEPGDTRAAIYSVSFSNYFAAMDDIEYG
ncbi:hypothetical protein ACJX0J_026031, partial [Zea mays]